MKFFTTTNVLPLVLALAATTSTTTANVAAPPPTSVSSSSSATTTTTTTKGIGDSTIGSTLADLPMKTILGIRRYINLNGILGSPTRPTNSGEVYTGYDKIVGHPVFQVTTAWGSAYMNMEKLTMDDADNDAASGSGDDDSNSVLARSGDDAASLGAEDNQYRTISLYYMDPNDALAAHAEFKQMGGMAQADVRITSVSLGKAIRSAANLGRGLITGQPIDLHTGKVLSTKEGGSLRHKIMPPKKQLFYAARCVGKERIGLFSNKVDKETGLSDRDSQYNHAVTAVIGNAALNYRNLQRKQAIRDRKLIKYQPKNKYEAQYPHMDGHLGIPVFYLNGMERHKSRIKSLICGSSRKEKPFFFNYEDLQDAWQKTNKKQSPSLNNNSEEDNELPENSVEVFNLWDVLTSMERENLKLEMKKQQTLSPPQRLLKNVLHPFQNRLHNVVNSDDSSTNSNNPLDSIVFIPSSDAITYKESISSRGNSEARLSRMRAGMSQPRGGNGSFFGLI